MASKWLQDRLESLKARWISPSFHTSNPSYEANLKRILELKRMAVEVTENRRLMDVREGMRERFPEPDKLLTSADWTARWEAMLVYAVAHADVESADLLGTVLAHRRSGGVTLDDIQKHIAERLESDPLTAYRMRRDAH